MCKSLTQMSDPLISTFPQDFWRRVMQLSMYREQFAWIINFPFSELHNRNYSTQLNESVSVGGWQKRFDEGRFRDDQSSYSRKGAEVISLIVGK